MTPHFIFDENVVILAQQGRDEQGNTSPVCADLVQQVIKSASPMMRTSASSYERRGLALVLVRPAAAMC